MAEVFGAVDRPAGKGELRRHAIAINAIIDGLWIEGCLAGDMFANGELAEIGIASVEAMLGMTLRNEPAEMA